MRALRLHTHQRTTLPFRLRRSKAETHTRADDQAQVAAKKTSLGDRVIPAFHTRTRIVRPIAKSSRPRA